MRQVATIPDQASAKLLADYLLTLQIGTKLIQGKDGWAVWVQREEKTEQAKVETAEFLANPTDPKYRGSAKAADAARREASRLERLHRKNTINLRGKLNVPSARRCPLTYGLIAISAVVFLITGMGYDQTADEPFFFSKFVAVKPDVEYPPQEDVDPAEMRIAQVLYRSTGLAAIRSGQVWRLVSPIFLHFGPLHLIFNMTMLFRLGGLIELRKGKWKMAGIVLFAAIAANFSEFFWEVLRLGPLHQPRFGGMSGVVYALFGYAWMKSDYDPESDMRLPTNSIIYMVIWLFFCMTGGIGPIANAAHVAGLIVGLSIGVLPHVWDDLRWW